MSHDLPAPDGLTAEAVAADTVAAEAVAAEDLGTEAVASAPTRLHLQPPLDVRSTSLAVIAVVASLFALHWAGAVFIPLLLGVMLSYALSPAVDRLQRWHVPRALGAATVLLALTGSLCYTAYAVADDASALIEALPAAAQKLRDAVHPGSDAPEGAIGKVQRAAEQLEQAAEETSNAAPAPRKGVTRVQVVRERFNVKDYLWSGTLGAAGLMAQALVVLSITGFLMASGDSFRRKMAKIAGPRFSQKKITVQVLDEITAQIQRYLLVQLFTSALVGVVTAAVFAALGLHNAAAWGVAAAVLNLVPYLGAIVLGAGAALMGFMQFGSVGMALALATASVAIHLVSGNLLTPWLTSRASRIHPVVIFVGVLAWGWLWGPWGLLLGGPLLMVIKAVCDRVEDFKAVGELLGA